MVLARAERASTTVETRRQPFGLDQTYRQGLTFLDEVVAPEKAKPFSFGREKIYPLQDGSVLTITGPFTKGKDIVLRPGSSTPETIVIRFTLGKEVREIAYDRQGFLSAYWEMEDGEIVSEHRSNAKSDEEREEFQKAGRKYLEMAINMYHSPMLEPRIFSPGFYSLNGNNYRDRLKQIIPGGEKYEDAGFIIPDPSQDLPPINKPIQES